MSKMTLENYQKGFLVDDSCLAGVAASEEGSFAAYVLDHTAGEYLFYEFFRTAGDAIAALERFPRSWSYEPTSACGTGKCGEGAQCGTGLCPKVNVCTPDSGGGCSPV